MPRSLSVIAHESNGRRRRVLSASTAAIVVAVAALGVFAAPAKIKTLPGPDSSNFYPFDQINKSNVAQLEMAWFYPYAAPTFSPVFAGQALYGLGRNAGALVALDPETGKEIWVHDGLNGITSKGINYWESVNGKDRRLIFAVDSFLQEIDASTGKSIMSFGDNGIFDMRLGLPRAEGTSARTMPASPGRIWRNIMIFGGQSGEAVMTPPGDIRSSTRFPVPASSATKPTHRMAINTSAARTTGGRCRSTRPAASSTFQPGQRPRTSTAATATAIICLPTACSHLT
jgi:hypothetical protein